MDFYVYIIESELDGTFYKGYSSDCFRRLKQHNNGECNYTKKKIPWKLIYIEKCESKKHAIIREKALKRCNKKYLRWLFEQDSNLINKF